MRYPTGFPRKKECKICGKQFLSVNPRNIYCGNRKQKTGCSYKKYLEYFRTEKAKEHRRKWEKCEKRKKSQRERKKKQRELNTDYAKRQREIIKKYQKNNKEKLKTLNKEWRKKNIKKIIFNNKRRLCKLKGVKGFHTKEAWEELKRTYNYCCAKCGVSEDKLKRKWAGTNFTELTEDHIISINKNGTDDINNIQPLCVSCNSQKKDN